MATGTEPTSGEQFVDTAVETSMSTAEVRVPRKWYYLTLAFLAWTGLYYVFVLSISLTAGGTGVWELAIVGLFIAHGPLAVFIYLDTRRVAAANRNPEVIERSRILGSWKRPLRIVVLLVALNYVLPLVVVALWYLVSTRPKALRAPEREPDVEGAEAAGEAEETQTGDPEEEIREKRDDERQEERRPEERDDKTEDEEKRERKDLPPLPPKRYQRARELKSTGEERAAAGDTLVSNGAYGEATTAHAEALAAYEEAFELVDGYDVDVTALRADIETARSKLDEARRLHGVTSVDELLARAREIAQQGDEQYDSGDIDSAIGEWTAAAAVYDQAVSVAAEEDAVDIRTLRQDLHAKVSVTEGERERVKQRDAEMAADEALGRARTALAVDEFDAARRGFTEAVERLDTALELAHEQDRDASHLGDARRDARRGIVDATLGGLEAELIHTHADDGTTHRGVRSLLERVRQGLNDLEASAGEVFTDDHHDRVARLRERVVIETLSESVTEQLGEMERAERLYASEKFFEAREVYRRVRANVGTLAAEHATTLTEEVEDELSRIQLACEMNVEVITKRIHGDTGESLVTVEDVRKGGPIVEDPDIVIDRVVKANLPGYTRKRLLGGGGFADIWVVEGPEGDAAVKIPRVSDYETIPESKIRRFIAEAENWQRVASHPNVVDVLQYGEKPVPWILLELCKGTLRTRLDADAGFDDRVAVLAAVGDALGYANAMGIAHLDIKPENVLFDEDGIPKLGDWGLSKVMTEGTITVTGHSLDYAAPEQRDRTLGERDIRTDVYQYGVLAYELLTGRHPFAVGSPEDVVPPGEVNSDLPSSVDTTLLKAMAYDQRDRYEQVVQVRDALTRALGVEA